jgi:carbonic anhydrase/acetyltransferase-like protein (isoleucine patch superfamily)
MIVNPYTMVRGTPAKFARELSEKEREMGKRGAKGYVELMRSYS